jgi:hypothetical protein
MTIAFVNSWNPHLPCSPIDEPRTIIFFAKGSYEHFQLFTLKQQQSLDCLPLVHHIH